MVLPTNLGYPRIGPKRELKRALERYWKGRCEEGTLCALAGQLRAEAWQLQQRLGIEHIPSNDFSLYDHVLDTASMVGAVPRRFGSVAGGVDVDVDLDTYFAMARGAQASPSLSHADEGASEAAADGATSGAGSDEVASRSAPLEMTKWFDTNYHYLVPELEQGQTFRLASTAPVDRFIEARALGIQTRPVLLGPVTFLLLGKSRHADLEPLSLLGALLPVYEQVLKRLGDAGASWVQLDEPSLVADLPPGAAEALQTAYHRLAAAAPGLRLLLATYFGDLGDGLSAALHLPIDALHLDLVRAPEQLDRALVEVPPRLSLSLGLVDGRNVWKTDLDRALAQTHKAVAVLGTERIMVGPSCSLLHSPVDVELETALEPEIRGWLAFAQQKLEEVVALARAVNEGAEAVSAALAASREAIASRSASPRIHDRAVHERAANVSAGMLHRGRPHAERKQQQQRSLGLPPLPTTTIGSFPQTAEVRRTRAELRQGKRDAAAYEAFLRAEIEKTIRFQEQIGLDVLVHGEAERNDMVEYFSERLSGFAFTEHGWVQSYGSRCVKPPIIYGDVARPSPMTVAWAHYAQSLTERPVKGMLTGPVTIAQWSFVRDDQPRAETCRQLALALRDEVSDLEAVGIRVIQIDEPALREGLPLRRERWPGYLAWAIDAFRLASAVVRDETQIHTHMCYSEFSDIIEAIGSMDADVIAIEASRSQMDLLEAFQHYRYPNDIGPGVYDIHSPRIPSCQEVESLLRKALAVLRPDQLWVNPDCGLKTRRWQEIRPALTHMVEAARALRATCLSPGPGPNEDR